MPLPVIRPQSDTKPKEIVAKRRQVEVMVGQGMARAIREVRVTEQIDYR